MQILYVMGVLTMALYAMVEVQMSSANLKFAKQKSKNVDFKYQQELKMSARKAYDYGLSVVVSGGPCPTGTAQINGVGSAPFPLCWGTEVNAGCFTNIRYRGLPICFANNQNLLTHNKSKSSIYALMFQTKTATAAQQRLPTTWADNSQGLIELSPEPTFGGGGGGGYGSPNAGATVVSPQPNAGNTIRSNHINCNLGHTECFTIVYCLNGSGLCTGTDKLVSTYAIRRF